MKKAIIAIAVLCAAGSAIAAPSGSAYDRIQDARMSGIEADVNGAKLGVIVNNDRITALENAPKPADGKDGKDGKDGINGIDGVNGKDGATGAAGADGLNGKDADMTKVNKNSGDIEKLSIDFTAAQSRTADLDARIAENKATQQKANQTIASHTAKLANHEERITSLESQTNARFSDLNDKINDNKKDADAGIAGVAAMANIPQVTDTQNFSIGAGVGARESESAVAVGFSARIAENVVTKAAVSADTQNGWTVGAGMSYGW